MIKPENIYLTINGKRDCLEAFSDLSLTIQMESENICKISLENTGESLVNVDLIELKYKTASFFSRKAVSYSFFKEGLTAVGATGSRNHNDCDFALDPNYLKFTVSDPVNYSWEKKNAFCSEQVAIIQERESKENLLVGFTTAENYFCRIIMNMQNSADSFFTAVIETDGVLLEKKAKIELEKLMTISASDVEELLGFYAQETGRQMKAVQTRNIPTGWCSYYFYYGKETEDDILENARFLAQNKNAIPVEYIQIDDGWQKARGDWLNSKPEKYPHGMQWLANEIIKLGFKPGIWIAPYLIGEETDIFKERKEWLLKDKEGNFLTMGNNFILDVTHPDAFDWITNCFKTIKSWGYSYFKLDFMMTQTCYNAEYYDKSLSRVQAYRKGLQGIRDAVGNEAFVLGGTSLIFPNVGLVNSCRISTDVTPFWSLKGHTPESPAIFNVCRNIINRSYLNQNLWINDPDCLIVREEHKREKYKDIPSLTLEETQMLATAMIMSGGSLFLGDRLQELPEERLKIIKKVISLTDSQKAFPVDRMKREIPRIWFRQGKGSDKNPHLLAFFNWDDFTEEISVSFDELGLSLERDYKVTDVWEEAMLSYSVNDNFLSIKLKAHTCKLAGIYIKG